MPIDIMMGMVNGAAWTPVMTCVTTPPTGITYGAQVGRYFAIGKLVFAGLQLDLTSLGSGGVGGLRIDGLPYTVRAAAGGMWCVGTYWESFTITGRTAVVLQPTASTTQLSIQACGVGAAIALTYTELQAGSRIRGFVIYEMV